MNAFILYAFKTFLAMGAFALLYRMILSQDVNFRTRRFFLLISLTASMAVPFLSLNLGRGFMILPTVVLDELNIYGNGLNIIRENTTIPADSIIGGFYLLFSGLFLFRIIYQIVLVGIKSRKYSSRDEEGLRIYEMPSGYASFSFFRDIFVGRTDVSENVEKILAHEKVHANQLHSLDVLYTELLTSIFWFNPLAWWYRSEIRNVHEYLADEGVLSTGFNPRLYQITLLENLIGSASLSITNQFNYSLIKNRIAMMNKDKKVRSSTWKALLLIPLSIVLIIAFSCSKKSDSSVKVQESATQTDEPEYYIVEQMPKFNGGEAAEFGKYIAQNLKYPESAVKNNITGKVVIQFAVNSKGKVVDAKVLKGADPALDAEALRVIESSPDWEPGKQKGIPVKVLFTFPINFALQEKAK